MVAHRSGAPANPAPRRRLACAAAALFLALPASLPAESLLLGEPPPESPAPRPPSVEELWDRGDLALRAGRPEEALEAFRAALELDPARARSWNYLGGAHFSRGDLRTALADFTKAFELDPLDVRVCNNIGTVHERLGEYARAEEHYLAAVRIDPAYPTSHRNLGVLYAERLGRPAEARRAWERFLELAPEGAAADEVRNELEKLPN